MGLLRLFLALSVVIHHLPNRSFAFLNAGVAVLCFFIISGFYMALIVNEKYVYTNSWYLRFYISRLTRIFPTYFAVLLVWVMWLKFVSTPTPFTYDLQIGFWKQWLLVLLNAFIFGQDLFQTILMSNIENAHNYISDIAVENFGINFFNSQYIAIGQAWSLAIELLFYVIAPFFIKNISSLIVAISLSILTRVLFLWQSEAYPPLIWGYFFPLSDLVFFCMGALGYYFYKKLLYVRFIKVFSVFLLIIWVCIFIFGTKDGDGFFYGGNDYDSIKHWLFYIILSASIPFIFIATKDSLIDRVLGELSYPLYLIHGLVLGIIFKHGGVGLFETEIVAIIISVSFAILIHILLDSKIDFYRKYILYKPIKPITCWLAFFLVFMMIFTGYLSWSVQWIMPISHNLEINVEGTSSKVIPFPPILIESFKNFNIVKFNNKYFAIPPGQAIDWAKDNMENVPGVIIANNKQELTSRLSVESNIDEPILIKTIKNFNIVKFSNNYFAIPHGMIIDYSKDDLTKKSDVISSNTLDDILVKLSFKPNLKTPVLIKTIKNYNIVVFNNNYYAIPHSRQIDWNSDKLTSFPDVIISRSEDELVKQITK